MGRWMAGHVLSAGHSLSVNNIPKEATAPLVSSGAIFKTPIEIAQSCDIVFTMVGFPHELRELVLGPSGFLRHMPENTILVDHTTSSPSLSVEIAQAANEFGVKTLDAPVSGGDQGARDGKLAIFVGGEPATYNKVETILKLYGANVQVIGGHGDGQHTKLTNQIALTGVLVGMVEAFMYASKAGLDLAKVANLIGSGAAGSMYFKAMAPKLLSRDHAPGFYVKHFVKDLGIALDECRRMNITLPGTTLANEFYRSMVANGEENLGVHALIRVLERLNNSVIN